MTPRKPLPRWVRIYFAWYDLWIGAYYDRFGGILYVCPLPMLVIRIMLHQRRLP